MDNIEHLYYYHSIRRHAKGPKDKSHPKAMMNIPSPNLTAGVAVACIYVEVPSDVIEAPNANTISHIDSLECSACFSISFLTS